MKTGVAGGRGMGCGTVRGWTRRGINSGGRERETERKRERQGDRH